MTFGSLFKYSTWKKGVCATMNVRALLERHGSLCLRAPSKTLTMTLPRVVGASPVCPLLLHHTTTRHYHITLKQSWHPPGGRDLPFLIGTH